MTDQGDPRAELQALVDKLRDPDAPRPRITPAGDGSFSAGPFTPESFAHLNAAMGVIGDGVRGAAVAAARAAGAQLAEAARMIHPDPDRAPQEPPVDMSPRAVALRARQNRNTGPRGNPRRHRKR